MIAARLALASTFVVLATPATSRAQQPSYARDVRPFLAKYCLECHNAKNPKSGLDLETVKGITAGGDDGPVLVPGNPDKSPLYETVASGQMPPTKKLPAPERETIRAWIAAGARSGQ